MIFKYLLNALSLRLNTGGGSGGSSSTQQFTPPSWAAQEWPGYLNQAKTLSQQPFQQYGGQTIAGLTPEQTSGLNLTSQTAMNSSPDVLAGRQNLTDTASGNYLNSNPYVGNQYTDAVIGQNAGNMAAAYRIGTGAQTDAAFGQQGAFGGSAYDQMLQANQLGLGNAVGQMANQYQMQRTNLGAQDYQQERNNMMQASGQAPAMQNMDLQAGQTLTGVGDVYRSYNQDLLNQGLQNFNQQQLYPYQQNDYLGSALARSSGNVAGGYSSTTTQPYQASPYASLLGLGALGYGAYSALKP